jgi:hypothetical protein
LQPLLLKAEVPVVVRDLMKTPEMAMDLPLKATLDMAESDLSFAREFAPEVVRSVPAKMRLNAKVGGTVKEPLIDSALDVDVTEVGFVSADMPSVREVKMRVRTHDRKAVIEADGQPALRPEGDGAGGAGVSQSYLQPTSERGHRLRWKFEGRACQWLGGGGAWSRLSRSEFTAECDERGETERAAATAAAFHIEGEPEGGAATDVEGLDL